LNELFGEYGVIVGTGLVLAAVSAFSAVLTPLKRYFIYTLVSLSAAIVTLILQQQVYIIVFAVAAVMMALGLRLMMRFTRAYPLEPTKGSRKK